MAEYTHEYYDILYELEAMHSQFESGDSDVSYIRDQLLDIVDQLYCKDWEDFEVRNEDDEGDDEDED